jgi:hypothetical protein
MYFHSSLNVKVLRKDENFKKTIECLEVLLMIPEADIYYLFDILSGDPFRIFGVIDGRKEVKWDLDKLSISSKLSKERLNQMKETLNLPSAHIKGIWCLWLNYYQLIQRGEKFLPTLAAKIFELDPLFFEILLDFSINSTNPQFQSPEIASKIKRFIRHHLDAVKDRNYEYSEVNKGMIKELIEQRKVENAGSSNLFSPIFKKNNKKSETMVRFLSIFLDLIEVSDVQSMKWIFKDPSIAEGVFWVYNWLKNKPDYALLALQHFAEKVENSNSKPNEEKDEEIIKVLPLTILFTGISFTKFLCKFSQMQVILSNPLRKFVSYLTKFSDDSDELEKLLQFKVDLSKNSDSSYINDLVPWLFRSGFFDNLIEMHFKEYQLTKNYKLFYSKILGIIYGTSIRNNRLTTQFVVDLFEKLCGVNKDYLKGLLAIIQKDTSEENNLKLVFKELGVDSDISLNLLELASSGNKWKYTASLNIARKMCGNPKLVSAMVAILKKDITYWRLIANALGLNVENFTIMVTLATKRFDLIKDKIPEISKKLSIQNEYALENTLRFLWGDYSNLKETLRGNTQINLENKFDLLEALLTLQKIGKERRQKKIEIDYKTVDQCWEIIHKQLWSVMFPQKEEFAKDIIDNSDVHLENSSLIFDSDGNEIQESSDDNEGGEEINSTNEKMMNKSFERDSKEEDLVQKVEKDFLLSNIKLLVFASLGDLEYQSQLAILLKNKLKQSESKDESEESNDWRERTLKGKSFIYVFSCFA